MISAYSIGTTTLVKAKRGLIAVCPDCGEEVKGKSGLIITTPYFSHKPNCDCDTKYEGISQWHLDWQDSVNPQMLGISVEVSIKCDGYKKRADIVTPTKTIWEVQKSPISHEECNLREKSYGNMGWIIHKDLVKKTWTFGTREFDKKHTTKLDKWDRTTPVLVDTGCKKLYDYNGKFEIEKDKFIKYVINGSMDHIKLFNMLSKRSEGFINFPKKTNPNNFDPIKISYSFNYFNNIIKTILYEEERKERERLDNILYEEKRKKIEEQAELLLKDRNGHQEFFKLIKNEEEEKDLIEYNNWVCIIEQQLLQRIRMEIYDKYIEEKNEKERERVRQIKEQLEKEKEEKERIEKERVRQIKERIEMEAKYKERIEKEKEEMDAKYKAKYDKIKLKNKRLGLSENADTETIPMEVNLELLFSRQDDLINKIGRDNVSYKNDLETYDKLIKIPDAREVCEKILKRIKTYEEINLFVI